MFTIATRRLIFAMLMPALCLVIAYLFHAEVQRFVSINAILPYLPYLLILTGLMLAWGFNNGRELNLLLVIGIAYWGLREFIWEPNLPIAKQSLLYASLCVLVPVNFLIHNLLLDRGVLRWQVVKRFSITVAQLILLVVFLVYSTGTIQEILRYALWKNPWSQLIMLTQPGLVAALLALLVMIVHLAIQPNILRGGNIMGLLASMMAINSIAQPATSSLYFTIAVGAILIAIILNSYNLAYMDELTNLPSRRALKQHLLALGKRYSIAMIDIDFFKKLNDKYGHDVGDQALRMVAAQLNNVAGGGKAFRYGGEEFTIIFANKDAREALLFVDNLREIIENTSFSIRQPKRPKNKPEQPQQHSKVEKIAVTVSAGVAQRNEQHHNPMDVIKSADKALYTAKRAGRNRVHTL